VKKILIVESHAIVRLATRSIIEELIIESSILEAASFPDTLALIATKHIDLIVLDTEIRKGEGLNMVGKIRDMQPTARILIFAAMDESPFVLHFLKTGAHGFISKSAPIEKIKLAVAHMLDTGEYLSDGIREFVALHHFDKTKGSKKRNPLESLSNREEEVMQMLLEGQWTKEIATGLSISGSSVSTYKARIFEKLHVTTLIELYQVVEFYRKGN
jgi:two-component system, NarL family, invasion response regulator UvrY